MQIRKFLLLIVSYSLLITLVTGCATAPERPGISTYNINGISYVSLISLCNSGGLDWQYDTTAKTVTLSKGAHKINLMVGDTLVLVDGVSTHLRHPVDIYQGLVVVPYRFKAQILEPLFKEAGPYQKAAVLPKTVIKKIVIDAGHGGNDPGAIGRTGLKEKSVNLDIAKRLAALLKARGFEVMMTRYDDKFISLSRRVDIANSAKADFFISVHSNANRVRSLNGLEVYYFASNFKDGAQRALDAAKTTGLNLKDASFAGNSLELKATLWDMIYTVNRAESIALARSVCRSAGKNLNTDVLGVKGARFYVLRGVRMPAVLIEVGFLSNSAEEQRLKNSYYRQEVAENILQAIQDYIRNSTLMEAAR